MSKMKNKHFDEISKGLEMVRLTKYLSECPIGEGFSPIYLVEKVEPNFNLSKEDILKVIRMYYKF
jgi:hypothetical protein